MKARNAILDIYLCMASFTSESRVSWHSWGVEAWASSSSDLDLTLGQFAVEWLEWEVAAQSLRTQFSAGKGWSLCSKLVWKWSCWFTFLPSPVVMSSEKYQKTTDTDGGTEASTEGCWGSALELDWGAWCESSCCSSTSKGASRAGLSDQDAS